MPVGFSRSYVKPKLVLLQRDSGNAQPLVYQPLYGVGKLDFSSIAWRSFAKSLDDCRGEYVERHYDEVAWRLSRFFNDATGVEAMNGS